MIPKVIHYCWFGHGPLPPDAQRCIESWRRHMPDYEIKQWDESNFNVASVPYTAQAYEQRKYAFVSDYARFRILYHHGGVYFDTDVELIRPLDELIAAGPFMGIEKSLATRRRNPRGKVGVNPGLGIAAEAGHPVYAAILERYASMDFDMNAGTVVHHTTEVLAARGYDGTNTRQSVAGITIYPDDVLCPMDSTTGLLHITDATVSIHHYSCSWLNRRTLSFRLHLLKNSLNRLLHRFHLRDS